MHCTSTPPCVFMPQCVVTHRQSFYVLLTVHLSIFISVINQLDAQNCFKVSLFHDSTCFEHNVLTVRSKLYYTASGIITPIRCKTNFVHQVG